jgi:MinD-like ATPase involved in chromosome partitioning or flagellar assembly
MLVSCWSAKGGSGTTVVAAALASVLERRNEGALLVDAAGDLPAVLGVPEPDGPGLTEWLAAGPAVPADALARLEVPVRPGLRLVPRGSMPLAHPERAEVLAAVLASDGRAVVVDVGTVPATPGAGVAGEVARVLAASATRSLLVTRGCYLSVRRAGLVPVHPSGVVLLAERGRALGRVEVEHALGAPVLAEVPVEPEVARAADSGLLGRRVPRTLDRALRRAA